MFLASFNSAMFPFREHVQSLIRESSSLNRLHLSKTAGQYSEVFEQKTDQSTHWHKRYYAHLSKKEDGTHYCVWGEFYECYYAFVRRLLAIQFPLEEKLVFQNIPNLRIQFPGNLAVGSWHRDGDYNHNPEEVNIFLPLTNAYGTNTIWTETIPHKKDYQPLSANYGEFWLWDGVKLEHGNKINLTAETRVSLDFRVIPFTKYKELPGSSINAHKAFKIGDYYSIMEL